MNIPFNEHTIPTGGGESFLAEFLEGDSIENVRANLTSSETKATATPETVKTISAAIDTILNVTRTAWGISENAPEPAA